MATKKTKRSLHISVVVRGGNVQAVHGLPRGAGWDLIDFDNLEDDPQRTIEQMGAPTLAHFKSFYRDDYKRYIDIAEMQQANAPFELSKK